MSKTETEKMAYFNFFILFFLFNFWFRFWIRFSLLILWPWWFVSWPKELNWKIYCRETWNEWCRGHRHPLSCFVLVLWSIEKMLLRSTESETIWTESEKITDEYSQQNLERSLSSCWYLNIGFKNLTDDKFKDFFPVLVFKWLEFLDWQLPLRSSCTPCRFFSSTSADVLR